MKITNEVVDKMLNFTRRTGVQARVALIPMNIYNILIVDKEEDFINNEESGLIVGLKIIITMHPTIEVGAV